MSGMKITSKTESLWRGIKPPWLWVGDAAGDPSQEEMLAFDLMLQRVLSWSARVRLTLGTVDERFWSVQRQSGRSATILVRGVQQSDPSLVVLPFFT